MVHIDKKTIKETIIGVSGESMLFITCAFLVAAVAATVLALEGDPKEFVAIGTGFVLAAGAIYTARGHLEKEQWKRLCITTLIAMVALTLSGVATADVSGATLGGTTLGFIQVSLAAIALTALVYAPRIIFLCAMYRRKRMIVKSAQSGEYPEAVRVAEGKQKRFADTD